VPAATPVSVITASDGALPPGGWGGRVLAAKWTDAYRHPENSVMRIDFACNLWHGEARSRATAVTWSQLRTERLQ
jgi:hypothetical protein